MTNTKLYALMACFADRYINCDDDQAINDATNNREQLCSCFYAVLDCARELAEQEKAEA